MAEGSNAQDCQLPPLSSPSKLIQTIASPNLQLSPEERRYFGQLFTTADADKIGVVTGEIAVKFFEKTRLPQTSLGEVESASKVKEGQALTRRIHRYGKLPIQRTGAYSRPPVSASSCGS